MCLSFEGSMASLDVAKRGVVRRKTNAQNGAFRGENGGSNGR